jgi:hypothetical protein
MLIEGWTVTRGEKFQRDMTYIYSTKITQSKWIYISLYLRIKNVYYSLEWGIVWLIFHKNLAFVIVQNYTPGGVGSNFNDFGNSGNFEFSRSEQSELYGNSRTASGNSLLSLRSRRSGG